MKQAIICCPRHSGAVEFAASQLRDMGLTVTGSPGPDVTHLLLPVPSFPGGDGYLPRLLGDLPQSAVIAGGGLDVPALADHRTVDFLKDPYYLADNAAITADCAIQLLCRELGGELSGMPVLVLGWGRIGKCLGRKLTLLEADVTIGARKDVDLAMIHALGHQALRICDVPDTAAHFRAILNTVPLMILPSLNPGPIAIELASQPGMAGSRVISARGLPGKMAPQASGSLIARSFVRLAL